MAKFTISMVKLAHEMAGGHFFERSTLRMHGDTVNSWKVVHAGNRIFLEKKKVPSGHSSPRYEFFPSNGRIVFDSTIQN